jgi:hypothetical protein
VDVGTGRLSDAGPADRVLQLVLADPEAAAAVTIGIPDRRLTGDRNLLAARVVRRDRTAAQDPAEIDCVVEPVELPADGTARNSAVWMFA